MNQRTLTVALIVSLVVNVFVIGAVAGAFAMRQRIEQQRQQPPRGAPIMRPMEKLPEDVRTRYLGVMRGQGQANRPKMEAARQARRDARAAFEAETFDARAAADALARARAAEMETRASLETAIVNFAKELDPEERKIIGESLRGVRRAGPGRGDGRGPPFEGRGGRGGGLGGPPEMGPPPEPKS